MELYINDRIRVRKLSLFTEFAVTLRFDTVASAFSFSAYFNPDNIEHKEMMCIGHDHIAKVKHNGEDLITGYVMNQKFTDAAAKSLVSFSGYSLPGFLEDCQIDPSSYPLQNDGLSLREISSRMLKPFGLKMIVNGSVSALMDETFDETTAEATETVKDYLTKLAAQKGIIMTHNEAGAVIFTRADTTRQPIIHYQKEGGTPFTKMELDFNGQGMHSDITIVQQADDEGDNAGEASTKNPYVPFVHRPRVITQTSGTDIDTDKAARMALSNELKNLKLIITTDRWEIGGKVIKPNNMITVVNPRVYLYKKSRWFIEQVDLRGDQAGTTATLTCALPEVYNNEAVKYLFKGINLH